MLYPGIDGADYGILAHTHLSSTLVLTNLGEKMSDDEVDELLKAVDTSSGEINYTDLVRTILAN